MQFEDIHLSDTQLYALFRQYYKNGAYQEALNILSQNPQLDLKAIIADNLNDLNERVYGMENVYYVEVEQYLADLLQSMQTDVNNLSNQNQYSATQQYYENNFVYYNNEVYFCIKEPPIGTDPTNATYWLHLGLFGENGLYGLSNLTFVGTWNTNAVYTTNQVVYIGYTFYWALQDNQGQDPATESSEYWGVLFTVDPQQIVASTNVPENQNVGDFWFQIQGD